MELNGCSFKSSELKFFSLRVSIDYVWIITKRFQIKDIVIMKDLNKKEFKNKNN